MSGQSILTREDTFFGVCFALGADFGFNPIWLRLLFALLFFASPPLAVGTYAAFGAVVALSRWLAPDPGEVAAELHEDEQAAEQRAAAEVPDSLPLAA